MSHTATQTLCKYPQSSESVECISQVLMAGILTFLQRNTVPKATTHCQISKQQPTSRITMIFKRSSTTTMSGVFGESIRTISREL